jgi:hypothetical protein
MKVAAPAQLLARALSRLPLAQVSEEHGRRAQLTKTLARSTDTAPARSWRGGWRRPWGRWRGARHSWAGRCCGCCRAALTSCVLLLAAASWLDANRN